MPGRSSDTANTYRDGRCCVHARRWQRVASAQAERRTARKLTGAIDTHAKAGGEVALNPIRLAIALNERPPDVPLRLVNGSELSIRRMRGRPMALNFWTSRSEPSLDHLEFLRDLHTSRGRRAPVTIAVGDGESPERVAEIVKERRLPYLVLPDPDRRVSRMFGVWCWPCTVWIRPDQPCRGDRLRRGSSRDPVRDGTSRALLTGRPWCLGATARRPYPLATDQFGGTTPSEPSERSGVREDAADLHVIGSPQLVQALIEHGLVDEFRLMIDPIVLGGGKRLFRDDCARRPLRLIDSQVTTTGALLATYASADSRSHRR